MSHWLILLVCMCIHVSLNICSSSDWLFSTNDGFVNDASVGHCTASALQLTLQQSQLTLQLQQLLGPKVSLCFVNWLIACLIGWSCWYACTFMFVCTCDVIWLVIFPQSSFVADAPVGHCTAAAAATAWSLFPATALKTSIEKPHINNRYSGCHDFF